MKFLYIFLEPFYQKLNRLSQIYIWEFGTVEQSRPDLFKMSILVGAWLDVWCKIKRDFLD